MMTLQMPGLRDPTAFFRFLDDVKERDAWLKTARKVVEDNRKAVRLLDAPDKIESDLKKAEKAKEKADNALADALAASDSMLDEAARKYAEAEEKVNSLKASYESSVKTRNAAFNKKRDEMEAQARQRMSEIAETEARLVKMEKELAKREKSVSQRERNVSDLEEESRNAQQRAKEMRERLQAALN